jgi:hypothetical protein
MKLILLLAVLLSSTCFANSADYVCEKWSYRVEFFLIRTRSSSITVTNINHWHIVSQSYAYHIEDKADKTIFHYTGDAGGKLDLTFKKQDTLDLPKTLNVWINTMADGFPFHENLDCTRLN